MLLTAPPIGRSAASNEVTSGTQEDFRPLRTVRRVFLVRRKTDPKLANMPRHDSIAHDITSPLIPVEVVAPPISHANFSIGDVVRHRLFDFRGVIFDVDPVFANSDEWYAAIPEDIRPRKDQPFYHLLAENM